jgi:hypothetical protein
MQKLKQAPNAQKWTVERVTEHLIEIKKDCYNGDVSYLGEAIVRAGLYIQIWEYWKRIFAGNDNIREEMLQIESIFEARLFKEALGKKVPSRIAVLGLKNNHKWTEKAQQEAEPEEKSGEGMYIQLDYNTLIYAGDPEVSGKYIRVEDSFGRPVPNLSEKGTIKSEKEHLTDNSYTSQENE